MEEKSKPGGTIWIEAILQIQFADELLGIHQKLGE